MCSWFVLLKISLLLLKVWRKARICQYLGLSYCLLFCFLHMDFHLRPYKITLTQELEHQDHTERRIYANWVIEKQSIDNDFSNKISFIDEAHFSLYGYVNKQKIINDVGFHRYRLFLKYFPSPYFEPVVYIFQLLCLLWDRCPWVSPAFLEYVENLTD